MPCGRRSVAASSTRGATRTQARTYESALCSVFTLWQHPMSFLSVEPQSRAVLESHNNSLLAQFDTQVSIIADRYLAFFQERQGIEATYIASLRRLHRKAKNVDASIDPGGEPTTTRTAWVKVRDNLAMDADARQGFIDTLANDVIKPLEELQRSNFWKRERVEGDLKRSTSGYADHSENTISKLLFFFFLDQFIFQHTVP